jgi:alkane 1-monooxygenase
MSTPVVAHAPATPVRETARIWALHLLCFVLPVTCFVFVVTAPHPWWVALPFVLVVVGSVLADIYGPRERRQPAPTLPHGPFDAVLYALVGLQLVNVALLVRMVAGHGFWRVDTLVGLLIVGVNSGYSAIVVAHELIHRAEWHRQQLGRLLLCTVLYEHFATEHIRGHHSRVGTPEDPATARFGETAVGFFIRTVPAQFRSAWRLEKKRLGDAHMSWGDPRMLRNRLVHGIVLEWGVAFGILACFGGGAFVVYVLQALSAVRLLEAVNYFEHYGLIRASRKVQPVDSWDTDSWFTLYTLVGLSRHADHHAHASRPYQQLRYFEESPKLRFGYFGTVVWLLADNDGFRAAMAQELQSRALGPFQQSATAA